jgi:hypothetical protein
MARRSHSEAGNPGVPKPLVAGVLFSNDSVFGERSPPVPQTADCPSSRDTEHLRANIPMHGYATAIAAASLASSDSQQPCVNLVQDMLDERAHLPVLLGLCQRPRGPAIRFGDVVRFGALSC